MMLAEHLNEDDRVSIVTYAGSDSVALEGAYGYEKQKINNYFNYSNIFIWENTYYGKT